MNFIDLDRQYRTYQAAIDARVAKVFASTQFILGPEVRELEDRLAAWVGVRHGVALSSGTDALLAALMAVGVGPGDEVLTTPFTFIATAEVASVLGAVPVFADIDPVSYCLDPKKAVAAITPRTKAIIPVSLYGQVAPMEEIVAEAGRRGIPVIEDACQSLGATRHGRRSGSFGAVGAVSFFPSKPLGCYGDGGMLLTDDDALAETLRQVANHGQEKRYHHSRVGINGRLDTLQAAVLLAKLEHFDDELAARERLGKRYNELLGAVPGVTVPATLPGNNHIHAQYTIRVADRDKLAAALAAVKIPTAVHYPIPLHLQPVYTGLGLGPGSFPVAEQAAREVISLPMHPFLTDEEQVEVTAAIASHLKG